MRGLAVERHPCVSPLPARRCTRPSRLRCNAKGNQKNEGMYFEYRPTGKTKEQIAEEQKKKAQKEQQQFGWANAARSSVRQYRKTVNSQRPRKPSAPAANPERPSQQQQQQQQQQAAQAQQQTEQESSTTTAPPMLQPKPILREPTAAAAAATPAAEADASPPPAAAVAAEAEAAAEATEQPTRLPSAALSALGSTASGCTTSSSKEATMQQRKQQMLQRMKGSATSASGTAGSTPGTEQSSPKQQAGAVAGAAAAAAAGAAVAAAWEKEPLMDAEGQVLLQELLELAEQLAGPGGYNSVIDNDPLSDPLAGLFAEDGDSSSESAGFQGLIEAVGEDSDGLGLVAAGDFHDAEAEELFAAVAVMQEQARSAAAALAADDAMPDYITASDIESSSRAGRIGSAAAELLAWEAEQAAGQQQIDIEAAAAAMLRGEVLGGDDEAGYEEGEEDEYELEQESENWLENDPELKKMMQADGAAFARMLADLNEDETDNSSSSSSSKAAAAADEPQQESWADLDMEDWLAAAESASAAAAAGGELPAAVDEDGSEDSELAGLLGAITADPSLDQQAKMQAKLNIQGMFNDTSVAAGGSSRRQRSSSSNRQPASSSTDEAAVDRGLTTTGDVQAEQTVLELRPKPVRPPVSE